MSKINLTIEATANYIKIEHLVGSSATISGTEYISFSSFKDEVNGWRFGGYANKIMFADIVDYNGSAIGTTAQADITTALLTARLV